jgi:hypothetical protein
MAIPPLSVRSNKETHLLFAAVADKVSVVVICKKCIVNIYKTQTECQISFNSCALEAALSNVSNRHKKLKHFPASSGIITSLRITFAKSLFFSLNAFFFTENQQ